MSCLTYEQQTADCRPEILFDIWATNYTLTSWGPVWYLSHRLQTDWPAVFLFDVWATNYRLTDQLSSCLMFEPQTTDWLASWVPVWCLSHKLQTDWPADFLFDVWAKNYGLSNWGHVWHLNHKFRRTCFVWGRAVSLEQFRVLYLGASFPRLPDMRRMACHHVASHARTSLGTGDRL